MYAGYRNSFYTRVLAPREIFLGHGIKVTSIGSQLALLQHRDFSFALEKVCEESAR